MTLSNSYSFIPFKTYKHSLLPSLDATYIITMGHKDRIRNIQNQLNKTSFSSNSFIVFNPGFKNCNKNLIENSSNFDIIHCNLEIFKHSLLHNYDNILILEDDFIIEDSLFIPKHITSINSFCLNHKSSSFTLSLGSFPYFFIPYSPYIHFKLFGVLAQSIIFSKKFRIKVLENEKKVYDYKHWDIFLNFSFDHYGYNIPLITQTFPSTENQKNWINNTFIMNILLYIIYFLKLNKQSQPGFNIIYFSIFLLHLLIIYFIFYKLFKLFFKYNISIL